MESATTQSHNKKNSSYASNYRVLDAMFCINTHIDDKIFEHLKPMNNLAQVWELSYCANIITIVAMPFVRSKRLSISPSSLTLPIYIAVIFGFKFGIVEK